jgi:hypothetical protein
MKVASFAAIARLIVVHSSIENKGALPKRVPYFTPFVYTSRTS